jgi:hypothetical protein
MTRCAAEVVVPLSGGTPLAVRQLGTTLALMNRRDEALGVSAI